MLRSIQRLASLGGSCLATRMIEPALGWHRMVAHERSVVAQAFTASSVTVAAVFAHAEWQTLHLSGRWHGMSSSASSNPESSESSTSEVVDDINAMFVEARDEIEFALEDSETVILP